jgi:leucyl-tRNA synthetase
MEINFTEIEKKVRQIWDKVKIYKTKLNVSKDVKKYILDMFPYPSGS